MPTRIRLQRHGKKGQAFFHIVIADGRAPRDGKYIEKIGTYNPNTNPATIDINFDKALTWLKNGAQPSDTCRAMLSYRGVLYRYHLAKGVAKGALTEEQADAKFEKWLEEKEGRITGKKDKLSSGKQEATKKRLAEESVSREAKAAKIAAKNTPPAEEVAVEEAPAEETTSEPKAESAEENSPEA
ncbi:MAG: 30S ribosomal protein S16 [Bacteroidetes bacterium]|nr:30S ribosomal protein S16 [Bacteroidota bacterium]HET6244483.1 30S ribosomal protein S16 [Bacteroidia bacterium]